MLFVMVEFEIPKIDYKDVENWLGSRGATGACPACGSDDWMLSTRGLALMVVDDLGRVNPNLQFPVATFVWGNCAFLRLHSPGMLKAQQSD